MDWAQILMMAFIVVFGFIRPFIAEPYKIPSGSMENTLFAGDRVLVLKFSYGAKLPATSTRLFDFRGPQAGDVFVFSPKHSPLEHFIKRVRCEAGRYDRRRRQLAAHQQQAAFERRIREAASVCER